MKRLFILIIISITLGSAFCENKKSPMKAMLFSAILPGTGELYSGNSTKAAVFLSTEAAIWLTYARLEQEIKWSKQNYMKFAFNNAGIPMNSNNDIYETMKNYRSSYEFNQEVELNIRNNLVYLLNDPSVSQADREYYAELLNNPSAYQEFISDYTYTGDESWNWNNDRSYRKYYNLVKSRQEMIIFQNFAISAAILNRIVSIVDAAFVTKNKNRLSEKYGKLDIQPNFKNKGVNLVYTLHF